LPISNKICSKTKYKKRSSRPLSLTKKKRINILQKVAVQSKKTKKKKKLENTTNKKLLLDGMNVKNYSNSN